MIADYLDRDFVLAQLRAQQAHLRHVLAQHKDKDAEGKKLRALMAEHGLDAAQLRRIAAVFDAALRAAEKEKRQAKTGAYLPSNPIVCGFQAGMTQLALAADARRIEDNKPPVPKATGARRAVTGRRAPDTSAPKRLKDRSGEKKAAQRTVRAAFVEGDDPLYGLAGIKAKAAALFKQPRPFNPNPARIARTGKPLTLFVFGDWGTGLPLARAVTQRIFEQIQRGDGSRQQHVIHLGDVYYIGEADEYRRYVLPDDCWPINSRAQIEAIGSWSLNGNHDRYSGGAGYFDTLLTAPCFLRWHQDIRGQPSSFFLIENDDWQIFGLDSSWQLPSFGGALLGPATFTDFAGQNGILTPAQVAWMKRERRTAKGCILLTHHQPASSRTTEKQHADEAVAALVKAGVYATIDAWIWGHEHRAVVFKPKAERTHKVLKAAPEFCCCLGHGGVPVTAKNFEAGATIADVAWQEKRLGPDAPLYEGERVVPFGFGRIDTRPGAFLFTIFDHAGKECYTTIVRRGQTSAPVRSVRRMGATRAAAKKPRAKKTASSKTPRARR